MKTKEKTPKVKNPEAVGIKGHAGATLLESTNSVASSLMSTVFMLYLTDYAGIGQWGAILGTVLLLVARLFDAVNDPLEGYIMDKAKVGKHGKYRPFLLLSVILTTVGCSALFALPNGLENNPVMICVWVVLFYLIFDIGSSFYAPQLLYRTMTLDGLERSKLLIGPRTANMVISMIMSSMLAIVAAIANVTGSMKSGFAIAALGFGIFGAVLSVIGLAMTKEKYHASADNAEPVKLTDIVSLLKNNGALRIRMISTIFGGFIWTLLFATLNYYVKWAYCTDLSTGVVDSALYGTLTMISGMMMISPLLLGTWIATPLMKKFGSPLKLSQFCLLAQAIPCGLLFVLHLIGVLQTSVFLFFGLVCIVCVAMGISFVPNGAMSMEIMDYEIYKNGRDRSALCNACSKFLDKAQTALSSSLVGVLLIVIGYEVDSATDTFLGELSQIPTMLTGFVVICGLLPFILGIIAYLINRKYPITNEIRAAMKEKLGK